MATIRILLGIICLITIGRGRLFSSRILGEDRFQFGTGLLIPSSSASLSGVEGRSFVVKPIGNFIQNQTTHARKSLISIAQSQIGVKEATGHNDGKVVEEYLSYVGFKKGAPWCAAFVCWVFGQAGFDLPRTAWSPALFPLQKQTTEVKPATVFGIYFPSLKRIAHCGFVERLDGHWVITIEGNTNVAGSREGDGVYRKRRLVNTIRYFADWTRRKEDPKHEKI